MWQSRLHRKFPLLRCCTFLPFVSWCRINWPARSNFAWPPWDSTSSGVSEGITELSSSSWVACFHFRGVSGHYCRSGWMALEVLVNGSLQAVVSCLWVVGKANATSPKPTVGRARTAIGWVTPFPLPLSLFFLFLPFPSCTEGWQKQERSFSPKVWTDHMPGAFEIKLRVAGY